MSPVGLKVSAAVGGLATLSGVGTVAYFFTRTTIEQQLVSEGLTLISNNEDYKFVLFTHKEDAELKKALSFEQTLNFNTQTEDIKKWCKETLKQWISNDSDGKLLKHTKAWCTVPKVKLLKDKIKGVLNKSTELQAKFTKLATTPETDNKFLEALNALSTKPNLNKSSNNGGTVLNEWCTSALNQKIYAVDKLHQTEENIKVWCFESTE